ncbi:MAG TPA: LamG-like jellyroll fold domain-containing protein, partial [Vicinamibacterales bacterium]|nr:LamG-like jellyroll fold domain-containing protein [Vicinamibacterales bacterium]
LSFDGVDDRVNVADSASLDLTTGMTLEAWVYPTALTDWRTVIMKEVTGELSYLLYAHDGEPRPNAGVRVGSTSYYARGTSGLPVNTWTHLASTYDGSALRLYVNGTEVGSVAVTGTITTSTLPLRIGGNAVWGEYFAGRIDEVRIYNRALSAAEIAADMSAAPAATPRLAITAPAEGSTVTGTTVSASFTSSGSLTEAHHAVLQLDGGAEIPTTALNGQISIPSVGPGAHTLGGYLARADQSRIAGSDATPVQFTVAIPDTIKPTVVIAAPRDGDTVSGSVTISATATDNVAIAGVQFKLNGENLGAEDTAAPYSLEWSTSSVTNGTHVLTAVARDTASNQTQSLDVNLVVANSGSPVLAGLVAAYGFEEGTGTSTTDGSGNSNTGTVSGATWTTAGRFGNALQFDGSNDRVNVADAASLDLTTGMTLAAWVYPTSATGWRAVVMKEATSSTEAYLLYANDSANRPAGYVRAGGSLRSVRGTAALPVNTWSHVATTYDGTTLRLFVNGTQVGTLAVTGAIATSNRALRIGSKGSTRYFAGRIDEVRVFNRALSVSELQGTMNAPVVGGGAVVQPTRSSSIALDAAGRRVWVVNPDDNSVTALHADTLVKQFEIPVGRHPTSIALDASNQVWIACRDDDSVWVLDATTGALRGVLSTGWGSGPASVVFTPNGVSGFIGYQGSARVQRVTPATRQLGSTLTFDSAPRALAVTADGTRLLVTRLRSGDAGGEIYSVDVNAFAAGSTISLPLDTTSVDGALAARGVPNYLVGLAIDPAGSFAWVVGKKDNIVRGALRDGQPLTFETTIRAMVGRLDLRGNQEQVARRIDLDNSSAPSAVALSVNGAHAFVTLQGNNRVVVLNQLGAEVVRADTGLAPQGVVIDAATHRVFTQDFMSRTVSVFDATRLLTENIAELPRVAQVATVSAEALPPEVLRGKQIFYSADTRISRDTYISCASCHLDGEHDGRVWDFTDRGEGLRNTISLKGGGGNAGAPLHWTANFDEVQDFENDIRGFFGGTGLMSDADFFVGTRAQPLGEPKAGVSADLDALAAYVSSLTDAGFSPHRLA